ncbi:MAG TPA: alanine--tRNA ligase-related protein [Candidatus Saccharimonadales bacterium]|nr:alanine--tRNA ligase-related protein [Candidatus Saccharimonadales bacterium]
MDISELRQKFLNHFSKAGYQMVPAAGLIPANDPSVLFTTAGMQQFKPFYSDPTRAPAPKLATVQPVIRTSDIAEVGDDTHLTMFEMLGIFSFGFSDIRALKKDAIEAMWSFVHNELGVEKSRVYATVFAGDKLTPEDVDSAEIWQSLGVKVKKLHREDNFWGPTGDEGPCGPNSEIFIDGIEVGNLVFNEYYQDVEGNFTKLKNFGLDFGSGLERLSATLQSKNSVWQIAPFDELIGSLGDDEKSARTIVDHLKAAVFLISAGIEPANKGREYVLRRLIRKAVFLADSLENPLDYSNLLYNIHNFYSPVYSLKSSEEVLAVIETEKNQFERNLNRAKNYLAKWLNEHADSDVKKITELAFYMYESFGFPKELVLEHLKSLGRDVDLAHFEILFKRHQDVSRPGMAGEFKGGLADHAPQTIKHHTAHHLLLAALQEVLGKSVVQKGSNVTSERLRIDFNFDRKLTEDELKKVAEIVNQKITDDLPVLHEKMPKALALSLGAQAEFGAKYGDTVSVYTINNQDGSVFSRELCGGPHVKKTGQLGRFEILKEEASSQGIRRIKARVV